MEQYKEIKWKTTSDLPIDDWKKLAKLFIEEKDCFERSKSTFGNRELYRIIVFDPTKRDFTPHFLIKANVPGDFYHTGSYHTFGRVTISELYWSLEYLSNWKDIYLVKEENMETKEIKINVPDGYEIDKENSTFECIKFKPVAKRWRDDENRVVKGFYVGSDSLVHKTEVFGKGWYLFATEKQAKSALAMAQISQIMADDKRFGGAITDEEWANEDVAKYCIIREYGSSIMFYTHFRAYEFLTFHTKEQRELFLKENKDLVEDYLMID